MAEQARGVHTSATLNSPSQDSPGPPPDLPADTPVGPNVGLPPEPAAGPSGSAPSASPVQAMLDKLHKQQAANSAGEVASYIPELATADPDLFGICLVTAGGTVYEVGDTRQEFTIQSISKPLTFALALEAIGEEAVRKHVDVEPSGEAFNSITLQSGSGIPLNPMVNAGAIATSSLIRPIGFDRPIDRILNEYSAIAGRDLEIDEAVFRSEDVSGHRNRAIAYLLKNSGALDEDSDVEDVVETYFRQCSTLVTCRDLAIMAATLASTGVNPVTQNRVMREDTVRSVLSVMASCGMYDAAGDWLYNVGLPAKSGVAGGIIAVLPGQVGVAVYSPPLDAHGNSVRGVAVCEQLSAELNLHVMSPSRRPAPPIRTLTSCVESRSRRLRPAAEQEVLQQHGDRARVVELQGEVTFAAGELISGVVLEDAGLLDYAVLDFRAVRGVDPVVAPILSDLVDVFDRAGRELLFSASDRQPRFVEVLDRYRQDRGLSGVRSFPDLDAAIEWIEDSLLERHGELPDKGEVPLAEHGATRGMDAAQLERLAAVLVRREYPAGARIYDASEKVGEVLLITRGSVSVMANDSEGCVFRMSTLPAGMTLGEIAMLGGGTHLDYSEAVTDTVAYALSAAAYTELKESDPAMLAVFLENLMKMMALRVGNLRRHLIG
jgi:glutaminase